MHSCAALVLLTSTPSETSILFKFNTYKLFVQIFFENHFYDSNGCDFY